MAATTEKPAGDTVKITVPFDGHTHKGIAIPKGAVIEVAPGEAKFIEKMAAKRKAAGGN